MNARQPHTDIPARLWGLERLPAPLRPYAQLARLDRPIGTWLLLFPCWWSLALALPGLPDGAAGWLRVAEFFALFALGAILMRGAGCTYNDIVDRDFDGRVERTRSRPLPSGAVGVTAAILFAALQAISAAVILFRFNRFAIGLGMASLAIVAIYPLMKRITYWPQAALGLAFNWGALLGWAAVTGGLALPAIVLYLAGIAWTLGYDTIYAHQDREDDALIGIKSLALKFGAGTRPWLWLFYGAAIIGLATAGALAGMGWGFFAALVFGALQLAWQAARVDFDDGGDCLAKFRSNRWFGWIVLAGIFAGQAS